MELWAAWSGCRCLLSLQGGWSEWPLRAPLAPRLSVKWRNLFPRWQSPLHLSRPAVCTLCTGKPSQTCRGAVQRWEMWSEFLWFTPTKGFGACFLPQNFSWEVARAAPWKHQKCPAGTAENKPSNCRDAGWSGTVCCGIENGASRGTSCTFQPLFCVGLIRGPPYYVQLEINPDLMHWAAASNAVYLP